MEFKNFFIVYDPTRQRQPALERAASIARETKVNLHVYACIYSDLPKSPEKLNEVRTLIDRQKAILGSVVSPLADQGFKVTTEVEWEKDWCQAVVRASIGSGADVVLKSSHPHTASQRMLNRTSDWTLIRECLCPVMLVKDDTDHSSRNVVAAIDPRSANETCEHINQHIIDFSRRVLENDHADVHFISAHKEFLPLPTERR